jgi:F-type H+-transporting ATPase subunit a
VNHYLGQFALALLSWLHITPENPETPIPEHVVMAVVVLILATLLALFLRSRLSVEKPRAMQQVAELLLTNPLGFGIKDLLEENVHHGALKLIPFVGSISVFVLLSNLLSVIPVFAAPTANKSVPLACAILTFLYFNWQGIRHHGVGGYLLTFAGSPRKFGDWALAILLFPVEIVSTSARILSLTVRLWANIVASDLLYSIFLSLFSMATVAAWSKSPIFGIVIAVLPATIPIAFIGLHIFVAIIQAYIFTVLPSVYLGMATADEH